MDIMSLDRLAQEIGGPLPLIAGMGGSLVEPTGFVLMNVKVPCVQGYNEDQVALVMDNPGMTECPVILGTLTLYQVMEVIKGSEISKLAVPWSSSRILWLLWDVTARLSQVVMNDVANKPIMPLDVDEVVRVANKCTVPTLTEAKRQELLLEKLDLTGLEAWPTEQAETARSLLREYHDIFSLEKHDTGYTKAAKHKNVLKDPDTPPFKERFCRIPPPQLNKVCAHLKMMLDAGVI